jgi:glycosyl transferase family 25
MREIDGLVAQEPGGVSGRVPTFIIGLPSAYRGKPLEAQLDARGIRWTRIDGVHFENDGVDSSWVDRRAAKIMLGRDMLNGEVGCALAHRQVYRIMVQHDTSMAMVFEDDARPTGNIDLETIWNLLQTQVPRVLLLYHSNETAITYRRPRDQVPGFDGIRRAVVPPTYAVAYALNLAAARLLLDDDRPVYGPVDWPVKSSAQIQYFFYSRPVVMPDPLAVSAIGDRFNPKGRGYWYARYFLALSHIIWLRYSKHYGSYRAYILYEFVKVHAHRKAARIRKGELRAAEIGRIPDIVGRLWR